MVEVPPNPTAQDAIEGSPEPRLAVLGERMPVREYEPHPLTLERGDRPNLLCFRGERSRYERDLRKRVLPTAERVQSSELRRHQDRLALVCRTDDRADCRAIDLSLA